MYVCVYGTIRVRKEKPLTGEGAGGVVWERWDGGGDDLRGTGGRRGQ